MKRRHHVRTRRGLVSGLFALIVAAAATGCGGTDSGAPTETGPAQESPPAGETTIAATDTDLGTILVDGEGRTLYLFTKDTAGTSACEGECLEAWPIVEGKATAGEGVDSALIGTIERSDGTIQASYNDQPLYYFAQDTAPGDVKGQGVNDVWWVVDPEGKAIKQQPGGEDGTGGY